MTFTATSSQSFGHEHWWLAQILLIINGAPAWFFLLNDCNIKCLECIQRSATRTILPELSYEERLSFLKLPTLYDFIFGLNKRNFEKMADDATHPLFNRIHKNHSRMSSRCNTFLDRRYVNPSNVPNHVFLFLCLILTISALSFFFLPFSVRIQFYHCYDSECKNKTKLSLFTSILLHI